MAVAKKMTTIEDPGFSHPAEAPVSHGMVTARSTGTTRVENPLLGMLGQLATSPNFNPEAFRMTVDLLREEKTAQAKAEFQRDLALFQAGCEPVPRKGRGHNNKAYARLEDILDTTLEPRTKHGFSLTHELRQSADKIVIVAILAHRGGYERTCSIELPLDTSGSKNIVQAHGSTTTYGKRMTAAAVLGVSTGDEDDDGKAAAAGATITDAQSDELMAEIRATSTQVDKFLEFYKIESVSDLPVSKLRHAKDFLALKRKKAQ